RRSGRPGPKGGSALDGLDAKGSLLSTKADRLAIPLSPLELVNVDLRAALMTENLSHNHCTVNKGSADFCAAISTFIFAFSATNEQNLPDFDRAADFGIETIDDDGVALRDSELSSARLDHRVHGISPESDIRPALSLPDVETSRLVASRSYLLD
ncbi:MAG: hypothetical protein ACI8RZ_002495, partial [Myxococcota bacterium]